MKTSRSVLLSLLLLLFAVSLHADSVQQSLIFQSLDQSIWGPFSTPPPMEHRLMLIDRNSVRWDARSPGYPNYDGAYESFEGSDFGAGARASTRGHAGLWLDMKLKDLGSVDVTYPVTPRIEFPDANSFRAGDTVTIYTSSTLNNGWAMSTTSPQFALELDASFETHADASVEICVFDCGQFDVLPSISINPGEFNIFTIQPGSSISKPTWVDFPVDATFRVPNIQTTASLDGRSLASSGTDPFVELGIDLADLAFKAAKMPIGPSFDSHDYGSYVVDVRVWYNIVKVVPAVELAARQNFRFDPRLKVKLQFAKPLEYRIGHSGPFTLGTSVDVLVGDAVDVRYPASDKQPTPVGPVVRLDNTFTSTTGFGLTETLHVSAAGAGVEIPSVTIIPEIDLGPLGSTPALESPSFNESIGPLYSHNQPLGSQDLGNLYSGSWQLEGFAPVAIQGFALDPENPIITIDQQTGATRNLGAGRRQVAYAIDFSNGGDVKLSDVHLTANLAAAYSAAHRYQVDQVIGCDVATNPHFDGAADQELLAPDTALEVGEKRRVILVVSVYPKPDPAPYLLTSADEGTSQLGTLVQSSDSSDVLLGPGVISSVDDFVLFGDHTVKLDSIDNSFGHVGANDFVEVKNGNSAILAGDLRAGRTIKVQGELTADYAYSRGNIDIVNKAKLILSGNMRQGANVPAYVLSAPAPWTPLRGNVWVGDRQSRHLTPGYYGDVTVNAGASLTMEPGTYFFAKLSVGDAASVSVLGRTRTGVIYVVDPGEERIGRDARVYATLIATRANVTFEERSRLEGAAAARSITMRPGSSASYHRDCDRLVDPDCDGSPNCR